MTLETQDVRSNTLAAGGRCRVVRKPLACVPGEDCARSAIEVRLRTGRPQLKRKGVRQR